MIAAPLALFLILLVASTSPLSAQEGNFPRITVTPVSEKGAFDDEPSMARASDGSVYVAWVSFRDGHDTLQVSHYGASGMGFTNLGTWEVIGERDVYVLSPRVVAADAGVHVVYASERGRNWDVYTVACKASGCGAPLRVTEDAAVDVDPEAAWEAGTLWIAWESNRRNGRRVLLASIRDREVQTPEEVSDGVSDYDPTVAADANGMVSVAWHRFAQDNYDIWLRERQSNGDWKPARRLTRAPSIDRHALLSRNGRDLWLVYENAQTDEYLIGRTNVRRVMIARVTPNGLEAPRGYREYAPLWNRSENASIAFDRLGRLWVAFLKPREPRGGWNHHLACFNGDDWVGGGAVTRRKGMDRRPSLSIAGDQILMAFQVDDLSENWTQNDPTLTTEASSRILLGVGSVRQSPATAVELPLEPLREPEEQFEAAALRAAYGEDAPTPEIDYEGRKLRLYYGDLHAHSDISVCNRCGDQSIDENYQHRRDLNRQDFAAITDHGYNIVPYLWNYTAKLARVNADPGRLVTFLAEEWTSSFEHYTPENPYGYYGHRNLILEDAYFPKWWDAYDGDTPADLWAELRGLGASFVQIPHQLADTGNVPTDWRFTDREAQPVAEIFQVRGSYEYNGTERQARRSIQADGRYLRDVWEDGRVIGVIASPDHGGGRGKACVWAEDFTRRGILEAIRRRHTFGTTAARIALEVRVDGKLMGTVTPRAPGERVEVKINARCPAPIARVEVCRNGKFIYLNEPGAAEAELTFIDTAPEEGRSYYYVRVIQSDDEIAWSSPVWFEP